MVYEPTPKEIRRKAAEIRAAWTKRQQERAAGKPVEPAPYTIPEIPTTNTARGGVWRKLSRVSEERI